MSSLSTRARSARPATREEASFDIRLLRRMVEDPMGRLLYLDHFGLRNAPFQITPNPDFFFGAGERGHVLYALLYSLRHGNGIVTLTGEVGTGKTMLARMLLSCAPRALDIAFIANPSLRRSEIVPVVADELGVDLRGAPPAQGLRVLQRALIERYASGRRVVLVIDEAHAMRSDALEEVRLLSNLESSAHKLLQILLVGQDELREVLARHEHRPLRERITQRFHLAPLAGEEVTSYLDFRMQRAGGKRDVFDAMAVRQIAGASLGLIRRINILADKSLMAAYIENSPHVQRSHVQLALGDAAFQAIRSGGAPLPQTALGKIWRRYGLGRIGPA
jgi:type II secretory pathway predicted ATPase ExeA